MIGSNNYLGLTSHPRVKEAAIRAVENVRQRVCRFSISQRKSRNPRRARGEVGPFLPKGSSTGLQQRVSDQSGNHIGPCGKTRRGYLDKYDHASIIDGCRLSFGKVERFRHNDMDDLERVLQATRGTGKLIIVDGVFSMEGDIADLPSIVEFARRYDARVLVDDAHGVGVLGAGRGTAEHFALEDQVDIIMGTYSKSLAAIGGFVAGSRDVISFIKHVGRSMIFSASLPPSLVASVSTALDIIEEEPQLRIRLWQNTQKMLQGYKALGYDTGTSQTPIVPVIVKDTLKAYGMCKLLSENGVFVNPVVNPGVPPGRELLGPVTWLPILRNSWIRS